MSEKNNFYFQHQRL